MTFTVNSLARCSGLNHWTTVITVGGQSFTIVTTPSEVAFDPSANPAETRDMVLARLRSAAKEGGATTFAQVQTALVGKSFQL